MSGVNEETVGKMKNALLAAVAACALTAGLSTSASALSLNYTGVTSGIAVTGSGLLNGSTSFSRTVGAGGLKMTSTEVEPFNSFVAWCLDIGTNIQKTYDYSLKTISDTLFANGGTAVNLSAGQKLNIQNLFNTAYSTLDLLNATQSAGFQLALWEIAYETNSALSLSTGTFKESYASTAAAAARAQADTYLAGLSGKATANYTLAFFELAKTATGHGSQNLVTAFIEPNTTSAVPLPAAAWLLAGGLGALGMAGRRRKAA